MPVSQNVLKRCVVVSTILAGASGCLGASLYWKSTAGGSDVFTDTANWSAAFTASSDSLRVGGPTATYPYSANLSKLTTGWGAVDSTVNDSLVVGGYNYRGSFELDCGSANTAYFRSIIVGDTKISASEGDSVMTLTSGKLSRGPIANDTGYLTVGRNSGSASVLPGVGYLYINDGVVNMDRMTVGEAGSVVAGIGHVLLQNGGVIDLTCEKTFADLSVVGLRINNGDFTWTDNGSSKVTTGRLSVNTAKLTFKSTDNIIGENGKGINVISGLVNGDGKAIFLGDATIDVTGLAKTSDWVTLVTASEGVFLTDTTLLTDESTAAGWTYRVFDLDGPGGNAASLQVIPEPSAVWLLSLGALFFLRRRK